jgi:hypothetical protein
MKTWPPSTQAAIESLAEAVLQGPSIQNFDRSLACQGDNAPLLQIRNGTAHRLDRTAR